MTRVLALFVILPILFAVPSNAQEIDWSRTRLFLTAQWLFPQKEFGQFWKSGPGLGAVSDVPLNTTFSFMGLGSFSWHDPSTTPRQSKIPRILLFKLGVGLQVRHMVNSLLESCLGAAVLNNVFIFGGPAAPGDIDNKIESEFGVALFSRVNFETQGIPRFGIIAAYEPIFTGPDPVATLSIGIVVRLF